MIKRGIVGRGVDRREIGRRRLQLRPERFRPGRRGIGDDVDVLQVRQAVADLRQLLVAGSIRDDRSGAGIGEPEFQRVLAEQREQRDRHQARAKRRQMRDRQFQRLRQEHRDAIAANQAVRLQHVGKTAGELGYLVERRPRRRAVLVDIDQREAAGAVGVAVAAHGGEVEPSRNVPAEIAVEGVVVGGFGEHGGGFRIFHNIKRLVPASSVPRTRGPIASEPGYGRVCVNIPAQSRGRGVWVPAFAGTT